MAKSGPFAMGKGGRLLTCRDQLTAVKHNLMRWDVKSVGGSVGVTVSMWLVDGAQEREMGGHTPRPTPSSAWAGDHG